MSVRGVFSQDPAGGVRLLCQCFELTVTFTLHVEACHSALVLSHYYLYVMNSSLMTWFSQQLMVMEKNQRIF